MEGIGGLTELTHYNEQVGLVHRKSSEETSNAGTSVVPTFVLENCLIISVKLM